MKAIPTLYRGTQFRSRLEARWAAFFDLIDWQWVYEPFDADGYIPDFLIHNTGNPLLVEVKPAVTPQDFGTCIPKVCSGLRSYWTSSIFIAGVTPAGQRHSAGWITPCLGYRFTPDVWWGVADDRQRIELSHNTGEHLISREWIKESWAKAGNSVQWKGKVNGRTQIV